MRRPLSGLAQMRLRVGALHLASSLVRASGRSAVTSPIPSKAHQSPPRSGSARSHFTRARLDISGRLVVATVLWQVTMTGTTRDLKPDTCKIIADRMRQIVAGVCATFGATGEITFVDLYPVVENHSKQAEIVRDLGCRLLGEDGVTDENLPSDRPAIELAGLVSHPARPPPRARPLARKVPTFLPCAHFSVMGAEDFSYFLQKVPGAFFFFGGREASHHGWAGLGAEGQRSNW